MKTNPSPLRSHWLDEPRHVQLLWRAFIVVLALTVLAEILAPAHGGFEIAHWLGFNAAFGFIVCIVMIFAAKALGRLLQRPDSFYAKDDCDD